MVCNFSQIFVAGHVCKKEQRREEEVKLYCSYVEVEEIKKEGMGAVFVLAVGNLKMDQAYSVHFITPFSSRGPCVCCSSFCGQLSAK